MVCKYVMHNSDSGIGIDSEITPILLESESVSRISKWSGIGISDFSAGIRISR